jgi:hypothetical protein
MIRVRLFALVLACGIPTAYAYDPTSPLTTEPTPAQPVAAPAVVQAAPQTLALTDPPDGMRKLERSWGTTFGFELAAGLSSRSLARLHSFGSYVAPHAGLRIGHGDTNFSLMLGGSYTLGSTTRGLHTRVWTMGPRFLLQFGLISFGGGVGIGGVSIRRATTGASINDLGLDFNADVRLHALRWGDQDQGGLFIGLHGDMLAGTQVSPAGALVIGAAF